MACPLWAISGHWASDIEDGIGYFVGIFIGISAGIAALPSFWKVGRSWNHQRTIKHKRDSRGVWREPRPRQRFLGQYPI
jgi:hypothetical protein